MSIILSILNTSKKRTGLLLVAALLFVLYQIDNVPRTDDEYLGEQIYWLMKDGRVKSALGLDAGFETYQSIFHKLFVYTGYVSCRIFGWSLFALHVVPLLCFAGFLFVFYNWIKEQYGPKNGFRFWGVVLLLLFNNDLLYAAADFRPEIMIMCFGFISYTFLIRHLQSRNRAQLFTAGLMAGLCMFAHLNGVIYIIAGMVLLLSRKQFDDSGLFAIAAVLGFLPYFADVLYFADIPYFMRQFRNNALLGVQNRTIGSSILKLLNEQTRFLFNERQVLLTLSIVTALTCNLRKLKEDHKPLLIYTLCLTLSLGLIAPSKSPYFMVLYLPFLYILIVEAWHLLYIAQRKKMLRGFEVVLIVLISVNLVPVIIHIARNVSNLKSGGIIKENRIISSAIPDPENAVVLCPRIMVFNEIGRFKRLMDIEMIADTDLVQFLQHAGIDYVVFSERDKRYFNLYSILGSSNDALQAIDSTQHYMLVRVLKQPE